MAKVLDGMRVLDLGRVLVGPNTGMLPANLGAEVVKIEPPDASPAPQLGQHNQRVLAEARFGAAETAELTGAGRRPPATSG